MALEQVLRQEVKQLKSAIKNGIKRSKISLSGNDDKKYQLSQVKYFADKVKNTHIITPYGLASNPSENEELLTFNVMGQEENTAGIPYAVTKRFKNLAKGEVKTGNPLSNSSVLFRNDGVAEINGSEFEGLVKIIDLTTKLNALVTDYNLHTHSGVQTGAGISGVPTATTNTFSKSDYENTNVVHGKEGTGTSGSTSGGGVGINDHSLLINLDYASSGHIGFEKSLTFSTGLTRVGDTISVNVGAINHNDLSGKQGGTTGQYYHLTSAEYSALHSAVTVLDTASIDFTLTGQQISAVVLPAGVDHNSLLNYEANRHFLQSAITQISSSISNGILTTSGGALGSITDNSANWDTAYSWGDHSVEGYLKSPLIADLDFARYKAIRLVCDNDTISNIPTTGSEVDGQWFYANDAKILYLYEQGWKPMVNFGTVNIYVDGVNGSDATGKGFASGTGAFATIQYAVNNIPCTVAGDIIINIASGTYSETITVQGKTICGNYIITFKGTLTELESGTIDSSVDSTVSSLGTITDTGAFTGDSYQNKLVWIQNIDDSWGAGGDFHYRIIDSHDNDTLTLVGTSTTMSGQWKVYDWATTIDGLLLAQGGQKSIIVEDIKFTGGEEWEDRVSAIGTKDYSSMSVRRCKADSLNGYAVRMWYNSVLETYYCYLGAGSSGIGLFQWQNIFLSRASKNYGNGVQNGFFFTLSFTAVLQGNTIVENNGIGVFANNQGLLLSNLGLFIRNNTTGIRTDLGCVQNLSGINYSGNTTDTNFADKLTGVITIDDILKLEPRTSAPTSPVEGYVYYDSTLKKHRGYDGTSWNNFY